MQGEALPPAGDGERAKRWTAARRQRGKIEEQRAKDADGLASGHARHRRKRRWPAARATQGDGVGTSRSLK